jgi:CheY-like chemotaxis protein
VGNKRGTILVIDDEPSIVDLFTEYLTEQGFAVVAAGGGEEGLARLATDQPDIVFLDMRMPGMDGLETLKRIRAVNMRVPVLMISANDDVSAAKEALRLGAFDYTLKPVDFDYLSRALDKMLASVDPAVGSALGAPAAEAASVHGLLYELALGVFRATRAMPPGARTSLGPALEGAALSLVQRGAGGDTGETVRALNQVRSLLRFAKDLGDIPDDVHRALESLMVRARRSVGLH